MIAVAWNDSMNVCPNDGPCMYSMIRRDLVMVTARVCYV